MLSHHIQWKERGEKADVNNHAADAATLLKNINFLSYTSAKQSQLHYQHLGSDVKFSVTKGNEVFTDISCVSS